MSLSFHISGEVIEAKKAAIKINGIHEGSGDRYIVRTDFIGSSLMVDSIYVMATMYRSLAYN